jgi:hypothetical protein
VHPDKTAFNQDQWRERKIQIDPSEGQRFQRAPEGRIIAAWITYSEFFRMPRRMRYS